MSDTTPNVRYNTYTHTFGVLIPRETGVSFDHQSGGMSIKQESLEGVFLPLKHPTIHEGTPNWFPQTSPDREPDAPHPITEVDLTEIPDRDYEVLPEWVKERGHFYNWDEYFQWERSDDVWWYGRRDLIDELRMMLYDPDGSMYEAGLGDHDISERWDSYEDLWAAIDARLPFVYERYDPWEATRAALKEGRDPDDASHPYPEEYPEFGSWRWITVRGSKVDDRQRRLAPWADDLAGETVMLLHPNAD